MEFEEEVSIVDHLDELRTRLIVSVVAVVAAFAVSFWQHDRILDLMDRQLPESVGDQTTTLGVGEAFQIALSVSLYSSFIIALPIIFYQLYAFVIPAFNDDHQGSLWPMLVFVPALFVAARPSATSSSCPRPSASCRTSTPSATTTSCRPCATTRSWPS
jgi:sec-independent protein translocase protein TatC